MSLTVTEEALVRQLLDQQAALLSLATSESTIISKLGATKVTLADLTAATVIDDADLLLIRQGTTEKSVSGSVVKSLIPVVADASETVKGIVELATVAEVQTGTDTTRAVHPAGLASLTATETRSGLIELATVAEAQAMSDAVRALSPARLASAFGGSNQSLSASGYQKLPSGLIIQWGNVGTAVEPSAVTFPITYPTNCASVTLTANRSADPGMSITYAVNKTTSGFSVIRMDAGSVQVEPFFWMSVGY